MNQSGKIDDPNECDKLAISIIDKIFIPINQDKELRTLGTIFNFMGIGLKDNMKQELYNNRENFVNFVTDDMPKVYESTMDNIKIDIMRFSQCIKNHKKI